MVNMGKWPSNFPSRMVNSFSSSFNHSKFHHMWEILMIFTLDILLCQISSTFQPSQLFIFLCKWYKMSHPLKKMIKLSNTRPCSCSWQWKQYGRILTAVSKSIKNCMCSEVLLLLLFLIFYNSLIFLSSVNLNLNFILLPIQ